MAFIFACNICTLVKYRGITYILTVCPICLGVLHCVFTDFFCSVDGLYHVQHMLCLRVYVCPCLSLSQVGVSIWTTAQDKDIVTVEKLIESHMWPIVWH